MPSKSLWQPRSEYPPAPPPEKGYAPFVTGSYAYGEPNEDSDIDLVMMVRTRDALFLLYEEHGDAIEGSVKSSSTWDNLNLILCTRKEQYEAWREGTIALIAEAKENGPVSRDRACEVFDKIRKRMGVMANP